VITFLSCCYVGKQDAAEAPLAALNAVPDPLGKWASVLVEICSYAGM
jgi:26S proteasome regulatory subunit N1